MRKIVIVGATSAIAEHCARRWAAQPEAIEFVLIARDEARAARIAADLQVRNPHARTRVIGADFETPAGIQQAVDAAASGAAIDIALIAHGALSDQHACEHDLAQCHAALHINAVSPSLFAHALVEKMLAAQHGTLALIGSVAGDRGRKSNYVYGAAKGLLERFAQGLQHRLAGGPVRVVLIKPGPTDTPMTTHLKASGLKMATVEQVAADIVAAIAAGRRVVYTPARWHIIMSVIRHLPAFIFNKLNI